MPSAFPDSTADLASTHPAFSGRSKELSTKDESTSEGLPAHMVETAESSDPGAEGGFMGSGS